MVVKLIGMLAGFGVSVFLGRTLGPDGLGIINLSTQIISLLMVLVILGLGNVLVKNISIGYERQNRQQIADNIYTGSIISVGIALVLALIGILFSDFIAVELFGAPKLKIPLIIALAVMVPQSLSRIYAAGLKGFRKIWQSSLVDQTLSVWLVAIGLIVFAFFNVDINVNNVAVLYGIGSVAVSLAMGIYWNKLFKFESSRRWIGKSMLKVAMPLLLVNATSVIASNADTIMLGVLSTTTEVGLYAVAARLALLTSFFLQVSNASIAPKLAALYADNKLAEMTQMVQRVTLGLIVIAIIAVAFFVFVGQYVLGLWGEQFTQAYSILIVLSIGQFFNIASGCAGMLLIMCGHEKIHGWISLSFVILNLLLNYLLIIHYGALGAAIATAITVAGENIVKVIYAKLKVGVLTLPVLFIKP